MSGRPSGELSAEWRYEFAVQAETILQLRLLVAVRSAERDQLRVVMERMAETCWNDGDIDGGWFQDTMVEAGLMVEVPASQEIREEYDTDVMYQLAWMVDP